MPIAFKLLQMDLRTLPKIELHRHLDCSMRFATMLEIAKDLKLELPSSLKDQRDSLLITSPMTDLATVLKKFLNAQKLLCSEEILQRLAFECIEDAYLENIQLMELRYSLTFISQGHRTLNWDKIVTAFEKGKVAALKKYPIQVGFISTLQRILSPEENSRTLDFSLEHKDHFVGVDLADNEIGFSALPFASIFKKAKKNGLGITIHAGEPNTPDATENVRQAIEVLGATRIGHGLQIIKSPEIIDLVIKNQVHLEICPTSNVLTQAVNSIAEHPIKKLWAQGVSININTDDPGIFDYDLTHEYQVCVDQLGLTLEDLTEMNSKARAASFIGGN